MNEQGSKISKENKIIRKYNRELIDDAEVKDKEKEKIKIGRRIKQARKERKKEFSVNREVIDWLWEHPEERELFYQKIKNK